MVQSLQSFLIDILLHCNVAHQSWESRLSSPLAASQLRLENRIWSQLLQKPRFCQQTSPPELPSSPQLDSGSWSFPELSITNKPPTRSGKICLICFTLRPLASRSSSQTCHRLFVISVENSLMWSRSPSLFVCSSWRNVQSSTLFLSACLFACYGDDDLRVIAVRKIIIFTCRLHWM